MTRKVTGRDEKILRTERLEEVANLSINLSLIIGTRESFCDLRAQQVAEAAAQAMNSRFDGSFAHLKSDGHLSVRQAVGPDQKALQTLENPRFTRVLIFGPQQRNHSIERRQRPMPLELFFRGQRLRVGRTTVFLRGEFFEADELKLAPALPGLRAIPFVGEEMFERRKQE